MNIYAIPESYFDRIVVKPIVTEVMIDTKSGNNMRCVKLLHFYWRLAERRIITGVKLKVLLLSCTKL
jgi:hypothetical protein